MKFPLALAAKWQKLRLDRRAVTALEYGLIASLVAIAVIAGAKVMGTSISSTFAYVATKL